MTNYVSTTSDKSKKTAKHLLLCDGVGFLTTLSLFELVKLSLGKFRDNVGNYLRQ